MRVFHNKKVRQAILICSMIFVVFLTFFPLFITDFGQKYAVVSVGISVLSLMIFYTGYDRRESGSRKAVLCAVFIALSSVGRFIPILKPVSALTIICAVNLGKECGFFCGSLSALISDLFFGMGPWTPFRMFAWGMIGLVAGILAPILQKRRFLLLVYGGICGIVFSLIMDVWNVLWYSGSLEFILYKAAIISALPFTAIYVVSNTVFLFIFHEPISRKMHRIQIKYGI